MNRLIECFRIARLSALKYLSSMTEEESAALEEWVEESAARREGLERMEQRLTEDLRKGCELEAEEEWRLFQKRLPRRNFFRRWAYAAAVAAGIGITAGGIFLLQEEKSVRMTQSVEHNVKEYKAKLILADGNEWNITDKEQHIIDVAQGTRVTTSGKGMTYEVSDSAVSASAPGSRNTLIVPRGGEFELVLADGTQVWVNSGSRLVYPAQFTGSCREVEMEGEVCFKVAKNENMPFIVKTQGVAVRVLGTFFNVEARPETGVVATTLVEGQVHVSAGNSGYTMKPDQQVVLDNGKWSVREVDASEVVRWIDGVCYFFDTSLEDIMEKLSLWYDVNVFFASPSLKNVHFSLEIKRYDDVAMVLSKVEKTGRVKFNINGRTIIVKE